MSAYLDVAEADVMEEGWRLQTTVGLELINQIDSSRNVSRRTLPKQRDAVLRHPRHTPPWSQLLGFAKGRGGRKFQRKRGKTIVAAPSTMDMSHYSLTNAHFTRLFPLFSLRN